MTPTPATTCQDQRRDKRRRAIIEAARQLFLEKGYGATTLSDIVSRSGGSLSTLYELFENKSGLLRAVVEDACDDLLSAIESATIDDKAPRDALSIIAEYFSLRLADPELISILRVIATETVKFPELGAQFYASGPVAARRLIGDYLRRQQTLGLLIIDNAEEAATLFLQMLLGESHFRSLCGLPAWQSETQRQHHVTYIVGLFLQIHQSPV